MLTLADFNRLIKRLKGKVQLVIGRAVLAAIDNSEKTQKAQVVALYDETITGVERFQEYGFETYPKKDAEVLLNFINGNRDQGVAVCVHDRRYRPQDLSEGDTVMYTYEDKASSTHRIHFKSGRIIQVIGAGIEIGAASGHKAVCIEDLVDSINTFISTFNAHTHTVAAAPGPTTPPVIPETPLVKVNLVTQETKLT